MKKFILTLTILSTTMMSAAFADWKEEVMDEIIYHYADKLTQNLEKLDGADPSLLIYRVSVFSSISGMCIGAASEFSTPIPEETIIFSQKILGMSLRGETPSNLDIRKYGIECLTYIEDAVIKSGVTKEEFNSTFVPILKKQLTSVMEGLIK